MVGLRQLERNFKYFQKNRLKYFKKSNVFYRPWGKYTNLFSGKSFLVKELVVNPKASISLQKHKHRSEHWTVTSGRPRITINKRKFFKNINETIFIPQGSIHRIENLFKKSRKNYRNTNGYNFKRNGYYQIQRYLWKSQLSSNSIGTWSEGFNFDLVFYQYLYF